MRPRLHRQALSPPTRSLGTTLNQIFTIHSQEIRHRMWILTWTLVQDSRVLGWIICPLSNRVAFHPLKILLDRSRCFRALRRLLLSKGFNPKSERHLVLETILRSRVTISSTRDPKNVKPRPNRNLLEDRGRLLSLSWPSTLGTSHKWIRENVVQPKMASIRIRNSYMPWLRSKKESVLKISLIGSSTTFGYQSPSELMLKERGDDPRSSKHLRKWRRISMYTGTSWSSLKATSCSERMAEGNRLRSGMNTLW